MNQSNFITKFFILSVILFSLGLTNCMQRQQIQRQALVHQQQKNIKNKETKNNSQNAPADKQELKIPKNQFNNLQEAIDYETQQLLDNPKAQEFLKSQSTISTKTTDDQKTIAEEKPKEHNRVCPYCHRLSIECWQDQLRLSIGEILPCACEECTKNPKPRKAY